MLINDSVQKCVVFLGTREKGIFRPKATAFYVAVQSEGVGFRYLVTAEHVISGLRTNEQEIWVRANLTSGTSQEGRLPPTEWWEHPGGETELLTDVAVLPVNVTPDEDLLMVPLSSPNSIAATKELLDATGVRVGHDIYITGLFRSHCGNQRNIPIIRVGNIAMMRDEPIRTEYCGPTDAYLVEARSVHGLSGSPVFINIGNNILLLGLMHGHFDIENLTEDVVVEDSDGARGIHTGIGVVIPVEKILETLNQPELIEKRSRDAKDYLSRPTGS
jgi:hypothetical protein